MKRLTINHIAAAGLRTGKRAYVSMAVGIFLSIFLVTVMCLGAQGIHLAQQKAQEANVGRFDIILMESDITDERLMSEGHFSELGHVYVSSQIEGTAKYVGRYDEAASCLIAHRVMEGRMPEQTGEIALERSILEQSRMEIKVGERVTLPLIPVDGVREERTFTLVGILNERSEHHETSGGHPAEMPAALISPDEPPLSTGRDSVIRVMRIAEGISLKETILAWTRNEDGTRTELFDAFYVYDDGIAFRTYDVDDLTRVYISSYLHVSTIMLILLGTALLLAAGVGIAQAMNSRLIHRSEEIGMLRAVGATRRQIRRIFGREAWILTLLLTPVSAAIGCVVVWGISKLSPDTLIFRLNPGLLAPIVLLSGVCILLSSQLPLRRASHIMPMSVLRDTAVLRKAKRIREKSSFLPQNLISGRMLRLYPSRQFGSTALISLMLVCVLLAGFVSRIDAGSYYKQQQAAFNLWSNNSPRGSFTFTALLPENALTDQDISQINSLPLVDKAYTQRSMRILLKMDEPHEYFKSEVNMVFHLMDESYTMTYGDQAVSYADHIRREKQDHDEVRQVLGEERLLVPYDLNVYLMTQQQADALNEYAVEGKVDLDALNAGREVLVLAPTLYWYKTRYDTYNYTEDPPVKWESVIYNDAFSAGQTLDFVQLYLYDSGTGGYDDQITEQQAAGKAQAVHGSVKVGAVLDHFVEVSDILGSVQQSTAIITTEQGMRAMGLAPGWMQSIDVRLTAEPDEETEDYIEQRLETIAMRGSGYILRNYLESIRHDEENKRSLLIVFGCMALVFLIVSVSLISGNVSRRIRADERMIGMLRAVGADERVLTGCYSRQVTIGMLSGLAIGLTAAVICMPMLESLVDTTGSALLTAVGLMMLFAALCAGVCQLSLRRSICAVTGRSIVENIREL